MEVTIILPIFAPSKIIKAVREDAAEQGGYFYAIAFQMERKPQEIKNELHRVG